MRAALFLLAASLLLLGTVPAAEAAPEPVGWCNDDATVTVCQVQCINPPCPQYVCVNRADVGCHWI